jgi:hypothetical protein
MTLSRTLLGECIERLGSSADCPETLPFSLNDTTAGSETELQAAVIGRPDCVDLPVSIRTSNYFQNVARRVAAGDTSPRSVSKLIGYLKGDSDDVWENSWVRFPIRALAPLARFVLDQDLQSDRTNPSSPRRSDIQTFRFNKDGEEFIRIPISYLLKLALADAIDRVPYAPHLARCAGTQAMSHFLNDV